MPRRGSLRIPHFISNRRDIKHAGLWAERARPARSGKTLSPVCFVVLAKPGIRIAFASNSISYGLAARTIAALIGLKPLVDRLESKRLPQIVKKNELNAIRGIKAGCLGSKKRIMDVEG